MRVDFHLHTDRSDGGLSPDGLCQLVRRARLRHWAVTDHDTLAGYAVLAGAEGLVPGVEITAGAAGREVHVVGLGIDPDDTALAALLRDIRARRLARAELLWRQCFGALPAEGIAACGSRAGVVTRAHLARAAVRLRLADGVAAVFSELLADERIAALDLPAFPAVDRVAECIRAAGGVAILAHPGIYGDAGTVCGLMAHGLDGLEVRHPQLDAALQAQLDRLAAQHGWLCSCGSDLHWPGGSRRPGKWRLPGSLLDPLLRRISGASLLRA